MLFTEIFPTMPAGIQTSWRIVYSRSHESELRAWWTAAFQQRQFRFESRRVFAVDGSKRERQDQSVAHPLRANQAGKRRSAMGRRTYQLAG